MNSGFFEQMSSVIGNCTVAGGVSPASWGQAQRNGAALDALYQQQAMQMAMQQSARQQLGTPLDQPYPPPQTKPEPTKLKPKGASMFTEVANDVKSFLLEHRGTLYFIAIALILDHLLFKDAFRHRLQGMADKMVAKVEEKIV